MVIVLNNHISDIVEIANKLFPKELGDINITVVFEDNKDEWEDEGDSTVLYRGKGENCNEFTIVADSNATVLECTTGICAGIAEAIVLTNEELSNTDIIGKLHSEYIKYLKRNYTDMFPYYYAEGEK